jgi:hypothetical protein
MEFWLGESFVSFDGRVIEAVEQARGQGARP